MSTPTPTTIDNLPTLTINQLTAATAIDPVNDQLMIYQNSSTSTLGINRNTFLGVSGSPVDTTSTQTLTNKTLTSPTINGATLGGTLSGTYTIGGTPTFPSSVTTLTGTQTLTNKTLTSPTINAPTITNATLSADTITGYTTSNSGSIYGIPVTTGIINAASTINGASLVSASVASGALATNAVTASKLSASAITLAYIPLTTTVTTTVTTPTQIPGLTASVTIPAGGRYVRITLFVGNMYISVASNLIALYIFIGPVSNGIQIAESAYTPANPDSNAGYCIAVQQPVAGPITYSAAWYVQSGTGTLIANSAQPSFLMVEVV